jgi:hypothetical protein
VKKLLRLLLCVLVLSPVVSSGEELSLLGGTMQNLDNLDSSYSWQIEYLEGLGEHAAWSLSYLNEGHVPVHHRDGNTLQFWGRANLLDRRLSLAAGAGPYFFFDTTRGPGAGYRNDHGWGGMVSASATWYTEGRWIYQLRTNWVGAVDSIDTFSTVIGVGYQLDPPPSRGPETEEPSQQGKTTENELTLLGGRTIVNSFDSDHSTAISLEYRKGLWRYVDWTVAWLHEGDTRLIRRDGLTTQLWGVREFMERRVALGVGGGIYASLDRNSHPQNGESPGDFLDGIATLTGSYRIDGRWVLRASWNRVITSYDRDTDVIVGGVGYRF